VPVVGGLDIHRAQLTFDYVHLDSGEMFRGRIALADREQLRGWLHRFEAGMRQVDRLTEEMNAVREQITVLSRRQPACRPLRHRPTDLGSHLGRNGRLPAVPQLR
jgi:hypothetical protein